MDFGHGGAGMMGPGSRGRDQGGSVEGGVDETGLAEMGVAENRSRGGRPRRGSADGGLGRRCLGGDEPDAGEVVAIAARVSGEDAPALYGSVGADEEVGQDVVLLAAGAAVLHEGESGQEQGRARKFLVFQVHALQGTVLFFHRVKGQGEFAVDDGVDGQVMD